MNDARARLDSYHALRSEFPYVAGVAFDVSDGLALALDDALRETAEDRMAILEAVDYTEGRITPNRLFWAGWRTKHAAAIARAKAN